MDSCLRILLSGFYVVYVVFSRFIWFLSGSGALLASVFVEKIDNVVMLERAW